MAQVVERKEPANLEAEMNALGCGFLSKTALTKLCDDLIHLIQALKKERQYIEDNLFKMCK